MTPHIPPSEAELDIALRLAKQMRQRVSIPGLADSTNTLILAWAEQAEKLAAEIRRLRAILNVDDDSYDKICEENGRLRELCKVTVEAFEPGLPGMIPSDWKTLMRRLRAASEGRR